MLGSIDRMHWRKIYSPADKLTKCWHTYRSIPVFPPSVVTTNTGKAFSYQPPLEDLVLNFPPICLKYTRYADPTSSVFFSCQCRPYINQQSRKLHQRSSCSCLCCRRTLPGGNVVLLYASKYHDVPQVVNVSGRYNLEGGIKDRLGKEFMQKLKEDGFIDVVESRGTVKYRVTEESLRERLSTDMHAACLSIGKGCRVLTVHGSLDEIIPVEDAHAFDKVIANHELQIIEGADHGYNKHHTEFAQTVLNFLKAAL